MNTWFASHPDRRKAMLETIRSEARACARYTGRPEISGRVMDAMEKVERHRFVPLSMRLAAYADEALPVGHGQTISQPFIVALMTDLLDLKGDEKVLEIGTGTGYQTAILAELARQVFSVECIPVLADAARRRIDELGLSQRVQVRTGNGWHGWAEEAPFDAVIATAAPERIPEPLSDQLAVGGRMVLPVGPAFASQSLLRVQKDEHGALDARDMLPVVFVPLLENPLDERV